MAAPGTPVRASFAILLSFETIQLMTHGRRPRIQKMKCLAQKLTEWHRIEKLWQKREIERFSKIERFGYIKVATDRRQRGSHFEWDGPILLKLVSMAS